MKGFLLLFLFSCSFISAATEQAEEKFAKWMEEKEGKVQGKKDSLSNADEKAKADRMKAETAVKEARAKEIAEKNAPEPEPVVEEAPAAEATEEAPAAEEAAPEAPAEEAKGEE